MKNLLLLFLCFVVTSAVAQLPPPPAGMKWQKIEHLSDEFDGTNLDESKWAINYSGWEGRKPARFEESAVSVGGGDLRITASKKNDPFSGWTHNGGLVRSTNTVKYGYFESRMKANKTFMSSTFWLINQKNELSGCDRRVTELDVVEVVGINTGGSTWMNGMVTKMNSNTHSRNVSCGEPTGSEGNKADLGEGAYEDYHNYGCWWKSETEVLFYLDGKHVGTVKPPADFNLPMYLRMVVETYDWNPVAEGKDGMNDTWENRTTYYDWTRSWELVPDDGTAVDEITFVASATEIESSKEISYTIDYTASQEQEVILILNDAEGTWLGNAKKVVQKGSGTETLTIVLNDAPATGNGYKVTCQIRPVGSTYVDAIDQEVTVVNIISSFNGVVELNKGWNLIGCPLEGSTQLETALSSILDRIEIVKCFDEYYDVTDPDFSSLQYLKWGEGYFVKVSEDCELKW